MANLSDKQLHVLHKHLTDEIVDEVKELDTKEVSDLIGLLINTTCFDFTVPIECKEDKKLTKKINDNIGNYSRVTDEAFRFQNAFKLKGFQNAIHVYKQSWVSDNGNSPSVVTALVFEDGVSYEGIGNFLYANGVKSIKDLLERFII